MKKLQMMLVYQEKNVLHSGNTSLISVRGKTNMVQSFSLTTQRRKGKMDALQQPRTGAVQKDLHTSHSYMETQRNL
ncbi:hypothetical protein SRHO_G00243290 [Serrasalmus rhombeus]